MKLLFALAVSLTPTAAMSQSSAPTVAHEARCFYASVSFSKGAEVAIGVLKYRCTVEDGVGAWVQSTNEALIPNCIFGNELHAKGARVGTADDKVTCEADGSWSR